MNWSDIKGAIGKAAPMVGSLLGGKAGESMGGMVASALGVDNDPDSVMEALQNDPEALVKIQDIEREHQREMRSMVIEAETAKHAEVNKTMRTEAASNDPYVRRWRPTYGYATCFTWVVQSLAVAAAIIAAAFVYPERAGDIMNGLAALMGSMMAMWGIALSVLGVNVHKRSQDKQVQAGQTPTGLMGLLKR